MKYMRSTILAAAFLLVILAVTNASHAAKAPKVDPALVEQIKAAYEKTGAIEASFIQKLTHKESGATEKRNGTLLFEKPLNIRWETAAPNAETLVINKSEIWDYIPDEDVVYRYSLEVVQDSRNIVQVLTGQAKLTKDFDVKNMGKDGGRTRLLLYPKEPTPQLVEASIWIDPASGFIRKVLATDFYGNTNEVELATFTPRQTLPAKNFQFKPPKGVEIEDLRNKEILERDLFK